MFSSLGEDLKNISPPEKHYLSCKIFERPEIVCTIRRNYISRMFKNLRTSEKY